LKTRDTQEKPGEDQVNTGKEDASPGDKETAPDDQDENPVDECRIKDPEEIAKKRLEGNDFSVIISFLSLLDLKIKFIKTRCRNLHLT